MFTNLKEIKNEIFSTFGCESHIDNDYNELNVWLDRLPTNHSNELIRYVNNFFSQFYSVVQKTKSKEEERDVYDMYYDKLVVLLKYFGFEGSWEGELDTLLKGEYL